MTKLEGVYTILSLCETLSIPKHSINSISGEADKFPLIKDIIDEAMIQYKRIVS